MAREQSELIIRESRKKISSQILQAKAVFRSELIDAAIDLAIRRLPEQVTEKDNVILLDKFLESAR